MALFLVSCTDKPASRGLRAKTREAHLAHLTAHAAMVKVAGAVLDEADGGPKGSLLVVEADTIEDARAFAAADPYARAGLFQSVEVSAWRLAVGGFA